MTLTSPGMAHAPSSTAHARGLLLVFVAGLLYASAGVFVRALPFDPWTMLAWRSLAGGLCTGVIFIAETGRLHWRDYAMGPAHWLLVPIGAVATICYIVALTLTTVADVMIVYATTPFVTAAVAFLWNGEVPTRRMMIASAVALLGVVVMIGAGGGHATNRLVGVALILVMNLGFALLLVLARRHPERSMTPVNMLGLLLASAVGFALAPGQAIGLGSLALMVLFGIVTVGIAMAMFMAGARLAPSAEVALIGISDVVLGPLMVFVLFGENPGSAAIAGGTIVILALVWNVWPEVRQAMRRAASGAVI